MLYPPYFIDARPGIFGRVQTPDLPRKVLEGKFKNFKRDRKMQDIFGKITSYSKLVKES
jgi:hypothetical protein